MARKASAASAIGVPLDGSTSPLKVLYYGRHGTGKTTAAALAASADTTGNVLVIDAEGGLKDRALADRGVETDRIRRWPEPGQRITVEMLEELHDNLREELESNPGSWYAVVFDSITELHLLMRENATAWRVARARVDVDPDEIDRNDYNRMTTQMRRIVRLFRDLPCHIVFTALERTEETGEIRPALSPALAGDLMGYVDLVGRTAMVRGQSIARFEPTANIHAKDRTNQLPPILANPRFDRLVAIADGKLDPSSIADQVDFLDAEKASATPNQSKED